ARKKTSRDGKGKNVLPVSTAEYNRCGWRAWLNNTRSWTINEPAHRFSPTEPFRVTRPAATTNIAIAASATAQSRTMIRRSLFMVEPSTRRKSRSFGGGFGHHADLLREGDEARVVLVGAQERIIKQLSHTRVVRRPGVLQPLEHLLRLLAQGVDLSDLAAAVVGVFVDQFF